MGTEALRNRKNWQKSSGKKAKIAEDNFYKAFKREFKGSELQIRSQPKDFRTIYSDIKLSEEVLARIYNPEKPWIGGIKPDYAIDKIRTDAMGAIEIMKTLYVDVKRQDGWVEGKPSSAGRGNVHERACRYFAPGLLDTLRECGKLGNDVLPFWIVFQGDITRDPRRVRQIYHLFGKYVDHFFLWDNAPDEKLVINHFNNKLKHLLD